MSFDKKRRWKAPEKSLDKDCGLYCVVRSRAGRDRGKMFVVIGFETDKTNALFALLCDGKKRTVSSPKRKRASQLECVQVGSGRVEMEFSNHAAQELLCKISNNS